MKYFVLAGEASGDLHGANLISAIKKEDKEAEFAFWGGDKMANAAQKSPLKHIKELAFMGFVEVIKNLGTILSNIKNCKKQITAYQPDVVVFIDYPGFNLRIAKWAKKQGFKTTYYISPQIWAWKENRVKTIRAYIDEMICILPFEKDFYKKHRVKSHYVGHPLLDAISPNDTEIENKSGIALLPGSRKQEINKMLPIMLQVAKAFTSYKFTIAAAPSIDASFYTSFELPTNVKIAYGNTQEVMKTSVAALVTSGTATLETALFETPLVVCYKANAISVFIAKMLIKVKFISLVNLIADKEIVKELIQEEFNLSNCKRELNTLLQPINKQKLINEFKTLKELLGNSGASNRAASIIVNCAQKLHS
ncbi:MAG: lipid-A-disaccharide synthase [Bacteroidia bacterium]